MIDFLFDPALSEKQEIGYHVCQHVILNNRGYKERRRIDKGVSLNYVRRFWQFFELPSPLGEMS